MLSYANDVAHIKEMIVSAAALAYYDVSKPVVIQCDASQSKLGVTLCEVTCSSRVMIQTKQNYAPIKKELLAIVYACEEFYHYIFGRNNVIVQSDQKLLETVFKKPTHKIPPTYTPLPAEL